MTTQHKYKKHFDIVQKFYNRESLIVIFGKTDETK